MLTSNLTWDRKVNQIILSTTIMFCLTIFGLLSKSDIICKTKANFARISSIVEKEYETEKIEAEEDQIIEREQIVLRKQIKDVCHSKQFRHITASSSLESFIIYKNRHFAYCRQAKVILISIDCLINSNITNLNCWGLPYTTYLDRFWDFFDPLTLRRLFRLLYMD